jgi:hypothetical protein
LRKEKNENFSKKRRLNTGNCQPAITIRVLAPQEHQLYCTKIKNTWFTTILNKRQFLSVFPLLGNPAEHTIVLLQRWKSIDVRKLDAIALGFLNEHDIAVDLLIRWTK